MKKIPCSNFVYEGDVTSTKTRFGPLINLAAQLGTKMFFPISRFTFWTFPPKKQLTRCIVKNKTILFWEINREFPLLFPLPLRMNWPFSLKDPEVFPSSLFTAEFFDRFSKVRCWVSFSSWSSLRDLPRNRATLSIPPRKSCKFQSDSYFITNKSRRRLSPGWIANLFQILVEEKEDIFVGLCTFPCAENLSKVGRIKD